MVVPEGGRGQVRQLSVPLWAVRLALGALGGGVALLVVLVSVGIAVAPRIADHDAVVGENMALQARLERIDGELAGLASTVQRVRVYDERLRDLAARQQLPAGAGLLDPDEDAARRAWIAGVVGASAADLESDLRESPDLRAAALERDMTELGSELRSLSSVLDLRVLEQARTAAPAFSIVVPPLATLSYNSPYGWRKSPFGRGWKFHPGLDFEADWNEPVYAVAEGLVVFSGWYGGYGNVLDIDHGNGIVTRYGHNTRLLVSEGMTVSAGDEIALAGSTGASTGVHLHFEIRFDGEAVDPTPWVEGG